MKHWHWSLAWAVLRGRIYSVERRIDAHADDITIHLRGDAATLLKEFP